MTNAITPTESHVGELIGQLGRKDYATRMAAREELLTIGETAVPALCAALKSADERIQWEAARVLAIIGDPRAAPYLATAIEDPDMDVRWAAAEALVALGKDGIAPLLEALMQKPESDLLRRGTHHVAHSLLARTWAAPLRSVLTAIDGAFPNLRTPIASHAALAELRKSVAAR